MCYIHAISEERRPHPAVVHVPMFVLPEEPRSVTITMRIEERRRHVERLHHPCSYLRCPQGVLSPLPSCSSPHSEPPQPLCITSVYLITLKMNYTWVLCPLDHYVTDGCCKLHNMLISEGNIHYDGKLIKFTACQIHWIDSEYATITVSRGCNQKWPSFAAYLIFL
jgi:hypothetical protein